MSSSSQTSSISLLSGICHGRVLEVISGSEESNGASSEKEKNILVLIKDRLYSLKIHQTDEIFQGVLISFEVTENGRVEKVKTEQSPVNFDAEGDVLRWRRPAKYPSRMELLRTRQQIIRGIREGFEQQDFIETETPVLVHAPSPESQLFPIKTNSGFLVTSPEFQMKRLLTGGFEKIYQLARCFRNAESGPLHNPEFTLLEWYRINEPLEVLMSDIEQVVMHLIETVSTESFVRKKPLPPWPRVTVCDLFKNHLNIILDCSESAVQLSNSSVTSFDKDFSKIKRR